MTSVRDTVVHWVDQRLDAVLAAPPMWGSPEAVEMQVLLLLEMRALALRPEQELAEPRRILDTYLAYLARQFPRRVGAPLCELVAPDDEGCGRLAQELRGFIQALRPSMLEENPFQHNDLAIKLTFETDQRPTMSAFTGYYEEFRRAARAVARRAEKATGRAPKAIEAGTDFVLSDTRVRQPNGQPADVVLLLGAVQPEAKQGSLFDAPDRVRDALAGLLTMGEWAAADACLEDLPFDDADQRVRLAMQARRVVPSRGIATAAIGGRLIGRSKPVEFRADFEPRFRHVIQAAMAPQPFDAREDVRAVDLDRGRILLGKQRLPCYVQPSMLGDRAEAGVMAHVEGQIFRPLGGRPFVLVDKLEMDEPPAEAD